LNVAAPLSDGSYVRISHDVIRRIWHRGVDIHKSLMIGAFGRALRKVAAGSGITTNEGFSGIYDFNRNESASQVSLADSFKALGLEC
jgi:hypothetical protein